MHLKGAALVVGVCLIAGTVNGCQKRYHHEPLPCAMAPWQAFPLIQLSDMPSFFNEWTSLTDHHMWPLGIPMKDGWDHNLLDSRHRYQHDTRSSGYPGDLQRNRLERLYQESVEKSKKVQEEMDMVKQQLDQLNRRSMEDSEGTGHNHVAHRSCNQRQAHPAQRQTLSERHQERPSQSPPNRRCSEASRHQTTARQLQDNPNQRQQHDMQHQAETTQRQHHAAQRQTVPDHYQSHPSQRQGHVTQNHPSHTQRQVPRGQGRSQSTQAYTGPSLGDMPPPQRADSQCDGQSRHSKCGQAEKQSRPRHIPYNRQSNPDMGGNRERGVTVPVSFQEVLIIPTRGFDPLDLNIRHHGNSIRVHASRTCDGRKNCVTREMETSYKLPYEIERGSMKASIDGSNIVIKGRPIRSQQINIHVEEESDEFLFGEEASSTGYIEENLDDLWLLEDSDNDSGAFIETERD